jgi:hypothetical protein
MPSQTVPAKRGRPALKKVPEPTPDESLEASREFMLRDLKRSGLTPAHMPVEPLPVSTWKAPAYRIHYPAAGEGYHRDRIDRDEAKYMQPPGTPTYLFTRSVDEYDLWRESKLKMIVEGEKKMVAGCLRLGVPSVGVGGAHAPLTGGELDPWIVQGVGPGDRVLVVYDGDVVTNASVGAAAASLARLIEGLGESIRVEVVLLPKGPMGVRMGLDDWLLEVPKGKELAAFEALPRLDWSQMPDLTSVLIRRYKLQVSINKDGDEKLLPNYSNAAMIIDHYWGKKLRTDKYIGAVFGDRPLQDSDDGFICAWIQRHHLGMFPVDTIVKARRHATMLRSGNALGDWLRGLTWDGTKRVDAFWQAYCGATAQPEEYLRGAARALFIGAVLRALEPDSKFDFLITVCGAQGAMKTSLWEVLGGSMYGRPLTNMARLDKEDEMKRIAAVSWLLNFDELAGRGRVELTFMKNWLSQRTDTWVKKYEENATTRMRGFVAVATTNERDILTDSTGNRRHLIVDVGQIDIERVRKDREQIWAEAVVLSRSVDHWWVIGGATEQQERHREHHPWEGQVDAYLSMSLPKLKSGEEFITTPYLLQAVGHVRGDESKDRAASTRMGHLLHARGMVRRKVRTTYIDWDTVPAVGEGRRDTRRWIGLPPEAIPETTWVYVRASVPTDPAPRKPPRKKR